MAQKTNLNAAPYFDDFNAENNYHRILFRPGFAVQARELTQLQSALQHQIEAHGSHIFREGAMVVPGQGTTQSYYSLKLASTFNGEQVDPSQYYNVDSPTTITGATTGVTAKVIGFKAATTTDQPLLYVSYERAGSDFTTTVFADGEKHYCKHLRSHIQLSHTQRVLQLLQHTLRSIQKPMVQLLHNFPVPQDQHQELALHIVSNLVSSIFVVSLLITSQKL
jgi:hypothetical protein